MSDFQQQQSPRSPLLVASGLCKSFREQTVLANASLTVETGDFLSIMGESGSGKSTFLNILAGNLRPDSGSVTIAGQCVTSMKDAQLARLRRTDLGFVYQALNLLPTLNGLDNILLPSVLDRQDLKESKQKALELAEELRVSHLLRAFPETMSGGERQRIAIARAMIHRPKLLMLDEPTGSLDSRSTEDVLRLLCHLNETKGVTILQVTHSAAAAAYGKRTVMLIDGEVTEQ